MISKKKIHHITELQELQRLAVESACAVQMRDEEGEKVVDAKSYIGMYALDFTHPIIIETDDENYHTLIQNIGETVE